MAKNYDVIVIGAGNGGLAAAARKHSPGRPEKCFRLSGEVRRVSLCPQRQDA